MVSRNIQPVKLFALIIGINEYQHYKPHLKGAVKDANEIEYFLIDCLSVPPNRITKLLDGAATKQRIIEEFQSLCAHGDNQPDTGDAILIYFAGHGAKVPAPEGWDRGEIETICPVDMSLPDAPEPQITGIPDIVLNELISQLAEQKGNNIVGIHYPTALLRAADHNRPSFWTAVMPRMASATFMSHLTFAG